MKRGLVLEGGAMRGMFTCGVLDVFMEHGIVFDGTVGVSAGAVFGCNIKSLQPGRAIRYNKQYCADPRYASFQSLLKTGDLFGVDFCYHELPTKLDVFDEETFEKNPMEFYVVCTDVKTGKAVYHKCKTGKNRDLEWMRASASMPIVSRIVKIGEYELLDGGIADSIPLRFFEHKGYDRNVVILTQPEDYRKKPNRMMTISRAMLRKYPEAVKAMADRHLRYNRTLRYIKKRELEGDTFVIRPPKSLEIGHMEKNPAELERVYQIGRTVAEEKMEELRRFLGVQSMK